MAFQYSCEPASPRTSREPDEKGDLRPCLSNVVIEGKGNSKGDPEGVVSWRGRKEHRLVLEKEKLRPLNSIPGLQRPCEVSSNSWLLLSLAVTGKMMQALC